MTLHDTRQRHSAMVIACGVFSVGLSLACTGTIMEGPGDGTGPSPSSMEPGPNGDGPMSPTNPGGKPEILPPPPEGKACESKEFTPTRVWRLTDDQYLAAVKDLVPNVTVPTILTPGRSSQQFIDFAELYEIGSATSSDIRGSANTVAADAVKTLDTLLACKGGQAPAACADSFIEGFASRAFRRPLLAAESTGLKAVYAEGAKVSQAEGIRMVISAVLQSGSFLYRTELGKADKVTPGQNTELTTHELASSLSFLLLNSIPDAELRAAADDGSLANAGPFKAQVERLLKLPRVQENLTTVYLKWIGLGSGMNADLAMLEKEFTPELKASMEQETKLFFQELLGKGGTINDILTSNKGFVDKALATHLGMTAPGTGFASVTYPAEQRSGILTLNGVIGRYSVGHPEVFRGKYVRDEMLCEEIPPPPNIPEIEELTEASKNLTPREQADVRLKNATCGACHQKMDPLGLSFSNFDALGRFSKTDKAGKAIDSSGALEGGGADVDGPVKDVVELGQKLAKSKVARGCVESKMFGYALGRLTETFDACEMQKIDGFVTQGGGKLSDLMAAIVYSSAFRFRTGGN